jgi:hypothetical protein
VKALLLDIPAPLCVLFVWDVVLKYLRKETTENPGDLGPFWVLSLVPNHKISKQTLTASYSVLQFLTTFFFNKKCF